MEKLIKILNKEDFNQEDLIYLLELDEDRAKYLFAKANEIRVKFCGDDVYSGGIIKFSNYGEENRLNYGSRENHIKFKKYRMTAEEIINSANSVIKSGIRTVILQSGKDAYYNTDLISYIVYQIKQISDDVSVTLSLSERGFNEYEAWKYAGADRYLLKHEKARHSHYGINHNDKNLQDRIKHLRFLKNLGYQVGITNTVGLKYQTLEDIVDDIKLCKELDCDMVDFGTFRLSPGSQDFSVQTGRLFLMLKTMAVARLVLKSAYISATTSSRSLGELLKEEKPEFGGNMVISNFTPSAYRRNSIIYAG